MDIQDTSKEDPKALIDKNTSPQSGTLTSNQCAVTLTYSITVLITNRLSITCSRAARSGRYQEDPSVVQCGCNPTSRSSTSTGRKSTKPIRRVGLFCTKPQQQPFLTRTKPVRTIVWQPCDRDSGKQIFASSGSSSYLSGTTSQWRTFRRRFQLVEFFEIRTVESCHAGWTYWYRRLL